MEGSYARARVFGRRSHNACCSPPNFPLHCSICVPASFPLGAPDHAGKAWLNMTMKPSRGGSGGLGH